MTLTPNPLYAAPDDWRAYSGTLKPSMSSHSSSTT